MYTTMEPVLRQLTILDTLIRLEDVEVYDFITEYVKGQDHFEKKKLKYSFNRAGVLPYYCLSWVITWCSHDLEDLEKIARLFDFFLCSNPFMVVYFSAAVVLSRRDQVLALPCETSTIHSFLTKLPKDLDVEGLCQRACQIESKYSVYQVQCESGVALDKVSAINRFEHEWIPIETLEQLNDTIEKQVIPILKDKQERQPIELVSSAKTSSVQQSSSVLDKLLQLDKRNAALYTLVTIGAGVGLMAVFMSNSDMIR
jgi:hypothetical protein